MNTFFEILIEDHKKVKNLFLQMETASSGSDRIFSEIQEELKTYMDVEEKFLYPTLEKEIQARDMAMASNEEHQVTKDVLQGMSSISQSDQRWKAKVAVLRKLVNHHIKEEEDSLFPIAKKVLDEKTIQDITQNIQQAKSKGQTSR